MKLEDFLKRNFDKDDLDELEIERKGTFFHKEDPLPLILKKLKDFEGKKEDTAWEKIAKALNTEYDESVWEHLAGNVSAPFEAGEKKRIAVKVIDERGNELMIEKEI